MQEKLSAAVNSHALVTDKLNTFNKTQNINAPLKKRKCNNEIWIFIYGR